ncbi:MAG: imidazole glycerol phosphate synthase subunit HisH [Pseudohongiellaceae bacterium]
MNKVAVIDYGMGNLHSVAKAVEHVSRELGQPVQVQVTGDAAIIADADRVIFPGVGAIRDCMAEIRRLDVGQIVAQAMRSRPVLAICVGMQALLQRSEENGGVDCLGFIEGEVRYFGDKLSKIEKPGNQDKQSERSELNPRQDTPDTRLKVPHIGWSRVQQSRSHPLWQGIEDGARFYFVHSYYAKLASPKLSTGITNYGINFHSAFAADNIFATQFHPEKSQEAGLTLLKNFLQWDGQAC